MDNNKCQHAELRFGSGDYYIFCSGCGACWMRRGLNKQEYGTDPDGKEIGAAPEESNQGFYETNLIRKRDG